MSMVSGCGDEPGMVTDGGTASDAIPDDASVMVRTDGFTGWIGGVCIVNADCLDSPAQRDFAFTCADETYCLEGLCHVACVSQCVMVRSDVNPCISPRICTQLPGSGGMAVCKITPVPCTTAATCPLYKPALADGGLGEWTCENGICQYPGYVNPTQ